MNVDWQRVILNLRAAGLSVAALARRVQVDAQTLRHYARGEVTGDPRFTVGHRLLDLHLDLCPERHTRRELTIGGR